jgi:hypothetical protein
MTRLKKIASAVACCAIWSGSVEAQWPHINSKLAHGQAGIRKVVILPARLQLQKVGFHGPEGMEEDALKLAATLNGLVAAELSARGVEILPDPAEQPADDARKYATADLQAKYDNVCVQLRRKLSGVDAGRYTLGDRVLAFDGIRPADAVVFIRGKGKVLTPARRMGFGGGSGMDLEIGVVDAKSGEVLAFVRIVRWRDPTVKADERFAKSIREAMRELPLPKPARKA